MSPSAVPNADARKQGQSSRRKHDTPNRRNTDSSARRPRRKRSGRPQAASAPSLFDQVEVTAVESAPFDSLGLPIELVKALANEGMTEAFPIQAATIPDALAGKHVLGRGQTGSGKTLAFGLPLLALLHDRPADPLRPRGLVLVPTRELATQVVEALTPLAKALRMYVREVVGGVSFTRQAANLRRGVDILVATPGRLSDHIRQGTCELSDVQVTALDEADQMADMGFLPQVRELLDLVPSDGRRLLFSATLDGDVDRLVREYMHEPVVHSLAPPAASVDTMDHHEFAVSAQDKQDILARIGAREGRTIMFVRTKHHADRLARRLRGSGVPAAALHGGKAQNARTKTLEDFRAGTVTALVATNVAARGIHVDDVSLVVHVEPPADPKDYLHRAGRTARAGAAGTVVTLVTDEQRRDFDLMASQAGVNPTRSTITPTSSALVDLAGAREPSGIALEAPGQRKGGRPPQRGSERRSGAPRVDTESPRNRRDDGGRSRNPGGESRDRRGGGPREGAPRGFRQGERGHSSDGRRGGSREGGPRRDGQQRDGRGNEQRGGGFRDGGQRREGGPRGQGRGRAGAPSARTQPRRARRFG